MSETGGRRESRSGAGAKGSERSNPASAADHLRRRLAREAPVAAALFRRLRPDAAERPPAGRRYRLITFCELLLTESRLAVFETPNRALALARWAADLAGRLEASRYGEMLIHDLSARAWARIGNAQRVLGDHREAEEAFQTARARLDHGSGDLLVETELLDLQASLRRSQGNYPEALRLLARAIAAYRRINDDHRLGRALISSGTIRGDAGDFARAIAEITAGLERIDAGAEPRLVFTARHNLAVFHFESGDVETACDLLAFPTPEGLSQGTWTRLRRRWLEGMIARRRRRPAEAEAAFLEARQGFIDKGLGFDAAQVSLHLATLYADQARSHEMKRLAAEMIPIFRSCGVDREALAALMLFRRAAEMEAVTARMLGDLAAGLERTSAAARRRSVRGR